MTALIDRLAGRPDGPRRRAVGPRLHQPRSRRGRPAVGPADVRPLTARSRLEAFRCAGPGFALVSLYGPVLDALGDALPLDQALILSGSTPTIWTSCCKPTARDGGRTPAARGGRRAGRGGRRQPHGLRLVVEQGEAGERGPEAGRSRRGRRGLRRLRRRHAPPPGRRGPGAGRRDGPGDPRQVCADPDFRDVLRATARR